MTATPVHHHDRAAIVAQWLQLAERTPAVLLAWASPLIAWSRAGAGGVGETKRS